MPIIRYRHYRSLLQSRVMHSVCRLICELHIRGYCIVLIFERGQQWMLNKEVGIEIDKDIYRHGSVLPFLLV